MGQQVIPVVKVSNLPSGSQNAFQSLHTALVESFFTDGLETLGIASPADVLVLFPKDHMERPPGCTILVEILVDNDATYPVVRILRDALVNILGLHYPPAHIRCYISGPGPTEWTMKPPRHVIKPG